MTFGPDTTAYKTTRERLLAAKAEDITGTMANILAFMRKNVERSKAVMTAQANKHRKPINYSIGDKVWLSSRNIETVRPSKKLEDKMLGPYPIIARKGASYELQLPKALKVHPVFHPNLLRLDPNDPIEGQIPDAPRPVETPAGNEWIVDDILDSRYYGKGKRLQYRVNWSGFDKDLDWYNTDRGEFDNAADVVADFHKQYPSKSGPKTGKPTSNATTVPQ